MSKLEMLEKHVERMLYYQPQLEEELRFAVESQTRPLTSPRPTSSILKAPSPSRSPLSATPKTPKLLDTYKSLLTSIQPKPSNLTDLKLLASALTTSYQTHSDALLTYLSEQLHTLATAPHT